MQKSNKTLLQSQADIGLSMSEVNQTAGEDVVTTGPRSRTKNGNETNTVGISVSDSKAARIKKEHEKRKARLEYKYKQQVKAKAEGRKKAAWQHGTWSRKDMSRDSDDFAVCGKAKCCYKLRKQAAKLKISLDLFQRNKVSRYGLHVNEWNTGGLKEAVTVKETAKN